MQSKKLILILSITLSFFVGLLCFFSFKDGGSYINPFLDSLVRMFSLPVSVFVIFLSLVAPEIVYLFLFSPVILASTVFIFWSVIFYFYYTFLSLKYGFFKNIFSFFPIFLIVISFPILIYSTKNYVSDYTEECLSGEKANKLGMPSEGALLCMNGILGTKFENDPYWTDKEYEDSLLFCSTLPTDKYAKKGILGSVKNDHNNISGEINYRDYCFIRLTDILLNKTFFRLYREEQLSGKSLDERNKFYNSLKLEGSVYKNTLNKICRDSSAYADLEFENTCLNYFKE